MDKVNLLTVSQFAEKAGVSKQAVYSRLNKDLNAYLTFIDGKKYIDAAALDVFTKKEPPVQDAAQILQSEIEHLRETLAIKDKQIADYAQQNKELIETLKNLTYTNQFLLNQQNKDSSPVGSDSVSKEESDMQQPSEPAAAEQEAAAPAAEPQKRGFWSRFFGL